VSSAQNETEADELTRAVVETGRYAARKDWGQPPRLFALAKKAALTSMGPYLPPGVRDAPPGSLIPIEQDPLPAGEPSDVLASIHWPKEVHGCVLVTEILVLPSDAKEDMSRETAVAEQGAADGREARLIVGVVREGRYACCLQLRGKQDLIVNNDMADDVVTALLGTF
jgi:hypothetical protein